MAIRALIGSILSDLGFVSQGQLDTALTEQQKISDSQMIPERLERTRLVAEARFSIKTEAIPFLGQILIDMGTISPHQLQLALEQQKDMVQRYCELESTALCSVMDMGTLVNSSLNLAEVLKLIMKTANSITNSVASTLMLLEENTRELVFSVPTGPRAEDLRDIRIKPGQGIAGWVAENHEPLIVPDVRTDQRFYDGVDAITGFETRSILCVPLKAKTKLIGVLEAINKTDGTRFTESDALMLSIFGAQAAMAIENARLYGELSDQYDAEKNLQKKIIETDKFLALGQMAAGVAHDFNNILGAIMGHTEMALLDISEAHPARQNLEMSLKATHRAKDIVNQILAFARKQELARHPLNLKKLVGETLGLLRALLPSTIEIRSELTDQPCSILADGTKIQQMIMNLCTNAGHAMAEDGGILALALDAVALSAESAAAIGEIAKGSYLKLTVSDTGVGMDAETINRIFDPYFTTRQKGVGTGLGLSVVHGIVKSHGGAVKLSSVPGKGTVFEIFLPRISQAAITDTEDVQALPGGNERILFIDDETALADLGRQMLERLGYRVTAMTEPRAALDTFQENPEAFDLVITDMTMPNLTGDVLTGELLALRPDLPVILCTGFSEKINSEKAYAKGVRCFLMKPISTEHLARSVRRSLDEPAQRTGAETPA